MIGLLRPQLAAEIGPEYPAFFSSVDELLAQLAAGDPLAAPKVVQAFRPFPAAYRTLLKGLLEVEVALVTVPKSVTPLPSGMERGIRHRTGLLCHG